MKWIGAFLGFINTGSVLGALAGFVFGALFDKMTSSSGNVSDYNNREYDDHYSQRQQQAYSQQHFFDGQRNSFLFSMLVLIAYVIRADGKVMHSEMEMLRRFLRQNFGTAAEQEGEEIVRKIFDYQKQQGAATFRTTIQSACRQISANMDYSTRLQLLSFLCLIAQADGVVHPSEVEALKEVAVNLGVSAADVESMLNLRDASSNLDAAYKVLGISPSASDDEVKAAYRRMALKHHPDRVATLGDDVRAAAEKKFKEINAAKDTIYKARGM